ncbi:DUF4097 family beta strand repeat-containing protein [Paenibacillus sp. FA6]|uniref:DUF4097 family beta strand repeat-containing protein n=1 Tax=Paenibacillus sp. FA6 TaxID=3413029 RepID=UPI003F656EA5
MLNIKKLSIIALLLLLVGVVGSVLTYNLTQKSEWVTEEITIKDENFTNIKISINDARVELIPTNEADAFIEISGRGSRNKVSATVQDSILSIVYKEASPKLYNFDIVPKSETLKVYVPKKLYDTVQIQSSNGSISAEDMEASEVNVKANDGRIELRDIYADSIIIESDNGRIKAENMIGSTIKAKANDGRIEFKRIQADLVSAVADNGKIGLEEIKGKLSANANDGQIELLTDSLDYPIDFTTNNGRIDILTASEPTNATIHAQADNGSIKIFGEERSNVTIGSGEVKINLSSKDGKITVENR